MIDSAVTRLAPHALASFEEDKRAAMAALGIDPAGLLDLGLGDSSEPVAPVIREALAAAIGTTTRYPTAAGLPALREAVAGWVERRFGAGIDPEREVQPTQGSKEAVFSLALVTRSPDRDLVAVTTPGYAIPERGARIAGAEPIELVLDPARGLLPDLDDVPWDRLAVLWLNYPNNPTGATAPLGLYAELAERARRHGFLLASDEAYTELWWDEPPASALELGDLRNVVVLHSLSKRSGLTGYRTGFMAAEPEVISAVRRYRSMAGQAPAELFQRAAVAAWSDEEHVEERRRVIGAKREVLLAALERAGLEVLGSRAGLFLWVRAPDGRADEFSRALLARGVAVVPGRYFGPGGEDCMRIAPVPDLRGCEAAARLIEEEARRWTS